MKFPFFINAGLLFGIVEDESDWQAKISEQASVAQQSLEDAERLMLRRLRRRPGAAWGDAPSFGDTETCTGETLGEWAAEEAAQK